MGSVGAPKGNTNARSGTEWRQAIKRALTRLAEASGDERPTFRAGLDAIADELVKAAASGERWAVEQVGDRADGKAHQSLGITESDEEGRLADVDDAWNMIYPEKRDEE